LSRLPYYPSSLKLNLAGGYNSQQEYDGIISLSTSSPYEINFLGKLGQPELAEVYQDSDVFVLPSFFEGLPLVVIEAIACGCIAVVTDLPGIRQWFDSTIPYAPIIYVSPPKMQNIDEPVESQLPSFEKRLANAVEEAISLAKRLRISGDESPFECSRLTWTSLADRMVYIASASQQFD
ncbi:MAG: glycosyltransferase family 4 protein, partial [Eggerthellaceae bacterium]|nr:glycosyltransferase family 4 protein [Eggerthellaceae bacterium]